MSRIKKLFKTLYIYNSIVLHMGANIVICGHTLSDYSSMLHPKGGK